MSGPSGGQRKGVFIATVGQDRAQVRGSAKNLYRVTLRLRSWHALDEVKHVLRCEGNFG